jgi:son of sevenless-like protein
VNEVQRLMEAKDGMYDLASRLVDAAERLADAPFRFAEQVNGIEGKERERRTAEVLAEYELDRGDLIRVASEGLKHGGQCAGVVRYCLMPGVQTPARLRAVATPRQGPRAGMDTTPRVEVHLNSDEEESGAEGTKRKSKVGVRGVHTLSGLHRRVESLGKGKGWVAGVQGMLGVPFEFPRGGHTGQRFLGGEGGSRDHADESEDDTGRYRSSQAGSEEDMEEMTGVGSEEENAKRNAGLGYGLQVPVRPS